MNIDNDTHIQHRPDTTNSKNEDRLRLLLGTLCITMAVLSIVSKYGLGTAELYSPVTTVVFAPVGVYAVFR